VLVPITHRLEREERVLVGIDQWRPVEGLQLLERCLRCIGSAAEISLDCPVRIGLPPVVDVLPIYAVDAMDWELALPVLLISRAANQRSD
jgi:hypothetical protein